MLGRNEPKQPDELICIISPNRDALFGQNYTVWRLGMVELTNIFTLKNIIIYLLIINIIAFLAMFIDKKKAEKDRWRIKESTLLTLALIGGSIGSIAGMYTFHHKTKKPRFFIGIPVIIVLQIMLIIAIVIR